MSTPEQMTPGDSGTGDGSPRSGQPEMTATASPAREPQASAAAGRVRRAHRFLVPILFVLATLTLFGGAFAVWVNRQALNTDNWTTTSGKLLANKKIDDALGAYLVNQVFTGDVQAAVQQKLPAQLQGLAGPASAAVKQLAERAAPELLANPNVQAVWVQANRAAHKELLRVINGGGPVVSTKAGVVTLNLHQLVGQLASNLGVQSQVAAVQSKLQGSTGAQARTLAQQKLGITLPPASGQLVIMRANQLKTAQDIAGAVKSLAIVLPALAIVLFALAVWFARDRRRRALRTAGWCFVVVGVLLLLIRRVGGNQIVNSLVKVPSNKPAVHEVWNIATSLLFAIAVALIVYGVIFALAAWLAGPTRPARAIRQTLAPSLRESPAMAYGIAGGLLLLLVAWGPTPAFRQIAWICLFAALLALGVTMLRRQTAAEFPDAQSGDALRELRERRAPVGAPRPMAPEPEKAAGASPTLAELDHLVEMHDRGALSDSEFAAAKTKVMNGL